MVNKGADGSVMAFDPPLTKIAVGDTVHFVEKDQGHNAQTIPGMIPDGATPINGQIGQDVTVTFTVPGVYGVRCIPHFSDGDGWAGGGWRRPGRPISMRPRRRTSRRSPRSGSIRSGRRSSKYAVAPSPLGIAWSRATKKRKARGWQRPVKVSLGLLPSGPDPVGEEHVRANLSGRYIGQMRLGCKGPQLSAI